MKILDIERIINKKIKKSKIAEILNYFFYWNEFCIWLQNQNNKEISELDGNFKKRWKFILEFEKGYTSPKGLFDEHISNEIS